jgi:hypothetical protein
MSGSVRVVLMLNLTSQMESELGYAWHNAEAIRYVNSAAKLAVT